MITMIAAMDREGGIGYKGQLPWPRIPTEIGHLRSAIAEADVLLAGRKTWEELPPSLQGKVWRVSRNNLNLNKAWQRALLQEVWVLGGAEMYKAFMAYAGRLVLSYVDGTWPADAFFPGAEFRADAPFAFHDPQAWVKNPASPFPKGWQVCPESGVRFWVDDLIRRKGVEDGGERHG